MRIVQPKLDARVQSEGFLKKLKDRVVPEDEKFNLRVYNHPLLNGAKKTKEEWIRWVEMEMKIKEI